MKKTSLIFLFLMLVLSLIFVSCTGENNPGENTGTKAETKVTTEAHEQTQNTTGIHTSEGTNPTGSEENTDFDGMDTDDKWTKPY